MRTRSSLSRRLVRLVDGMRIVLQVPKAQQNYANAFVHNIGPDEIEISTKIGGSTTTMTCPVDAYCTFPLPAGAKNVVLKDANSGNSLGAKGTLLWTF